MILRLGDQWRGILSSASIAIVVVFSAFARTSVASLAVDSPSHVLCPEAAAVRRAVEAQMGDAATGEDGWHVAYLLQGDGIQIELRDQGGRLHLQRQIPGGANDCDARAKAIAIIVERFFEDIGWTSGLPLPKPEDVIEPNAPSPNSITVAVAVGPGIWTRRTEIATGVFGVRVARGRFEISAHLLGPGPEIRQSIATAGKVSASVWGLSISPALAAESGRFRFRGGPLGLLSTEWARSQDIAVTKEAQRTTLAVGVAAGVTWSMSPHWQLDLGAGAAIMALAGRLLVTGWGSVLVPPRAQGIGFATLGYAF